METAPRKPYQLYKIAPETRQWLEEAVLKVVLDTYAHYNNHKTEFTKEPALSVTMVMEMLPAAPKDYLYHAKKIQRTLVWSALEKCRKQGKLGSSIGIGLNGREARNYEPPNTGN